MRTRNESECGATQRGRLLNLQRMSTEDGPGIRTTVFFKGCGLCCAWCHNPESISSRPEVIWYEHECIDCDACLDGCGQAALSRTEGGLVRDRERCLGCGTCVEACPTNAQHLFGTQWTASDLVAELLKDKAYFDSSGGGVTLSGGEPVLQATFAAAVLDRLREHGVHTALDTSGHCAREPLLDLATRCDLVLYDLKLIDEVSHQLVTGQGNGLVLGNLQALADLLAQNERPPALWVRTPLIPGMTDSVDNIQAIGRHLRAVLGDRLARWDLLPFNDLCRAQYGRLGLEWVFDGQAKPTQAHAERMLRAALESGWPADRVRIEAPGTPDGE